VRGTVFTMLADEGSFMPGTMDPTGPGARCAGDVKAKPAASTAPDGSHDLVLAARGMRHGQEFCLLDGEVLGSDVPWRDEVCVPPFPTRDGQRWPSDQAGLGVDVGEDAATGHPWQPEGVWRWWQPEGSVADG